MDNTDAVPENRIAHRIMVISGKGGVGKTTVSINLALGLALYGRQVGLLDADITGPNVPIMLGLEEGGLEPQEDGTILPAFLPAGPGRGLEVVSMAFLIGRDSPVVWKGPIKIRMLEQFSRISWGELDYLVIDLPPGTSDEPLTIAQLLEPDGVVVVTTPYDLALMDAEKAVSMARALDLPILGMIENMSGLCCPHCGGAMESFKVGGAERRARDLGVPFLGRIEIDPGICQAGDSGRPLIINPSTRSAQALEGIVRKILSHYEASHGD
jgi:ATP-binding protein involved in chromosome partitioning